MLADDRWCSERYTSVIGIFWGLLETFVGYHVVLDSSEDVFQGGSIFPVFEETKVLDATGTLVDARQVAFIIEFEDGSLLRIVGSALDVETVDSVFEVGLDVENNTL